MTPAGSRWRARAAPAVGVVVAVAMVAAGAWYLLPEQGSDVEIDPAAASGPALENGELVLAELEPNGLPVQAELVSTLTARGGAERVVDDPASTVNVAYLDRRGAPETGDGVVLLEVGGPGTTSAVTEATFDRPLPVALHAEYSVDGEVVAPQDVIGASGELLVRYTVTNTTAQQQTLRYSDATGATVRRKAPVFVPLAGTLDVALPRSLDVVSAPDAVRTTDASGRTVLRYSLLLAPPLGDFQDDAVVVLRTMQGATPRAVLEVEPSTSSTDPAVGFSAEALTGAVEGNTELAEGLRELSDQTGELARGAQAVADGSGELASGAEVVADQVGGSLLSGSRTLAEGAGRLATGATELAAGVAQAGPGAQQVADGLDGLSAGLDDLAAGLALLSSAKGLPVAADAAAELADAAGLLADGIGSPEDASWPGPLPDLPDWPPDPTPEEVAALVEQYLDDLAAYVEAVPTPTLVQSVRVLQTATTVLAGATAVLATTVEEQKATLAEVTSAAGSAAAGAAALGDEVCSDTPTLTREQCARLADVEAQSWAAAESAKTAAVSAVAQAVLARAVGLGVGGLGKALELLEDAVTDLSTAVRSDDPSAPGLVEGLVLLDSGLAQSVAAVDGLSTGADAAATGSSELAAGASTLADGVSGAAAAAVALTEGAQALAAGTEANADGVALLADGTQDLATGARQAAAGSEGVADGVVTLREEGVDTVADAVAAAVDDPAFAAAWVAANDARAADALPYGAPEGAVGHVAYRFTMPATSEVGTPAWQWWVVGGAVVAITALVIRRRLAVA